MSERTPNPEPLLIRSRDAERTLSLGRERVRVLASTGALPCYRLGRDYRFCPDELRAWIRAGCPTEAGAGEAVRRNMRRRGAG